MGILDRFKRTTAAQTPQTKDSATGKALIVNPGQPVWSNRDYRAFADEGYSKNVIAYQAINKVAEACAMPAPILYRGDEEITESPLLELLKKPNPLQIFSEYTQAIVGYFLLSGNNYQEKVLVGAEPRELYALRSDRMKVIPSDNGFPSGFEYAVGQNKVRFDFDAGDVLSSPVWQTKTFNPLDDWYGLSPVEAGAYAVDQHNEAQKWMQALLQNSARPSGALVVTGDQTLSDEQFYRLKAQTEEQYQGSMNAGRPMLLEGGLDWKAMGLSPTDMGIIEAKYSSARDVCLAFGVPPQLLGIPGDNTYSNYAEARLAFWEDTVLPLLGTIYGAWNVWLTPHYGEGLELRPNLEKIPAIVDKRMKLWEMADASSDLTINERRKLKGYGEVPGGDEIVMPANMLPMGFGAMPEGDVKAMSTVAGYSNVTPLDRKAK